MTWYARQQRKESDFAGPWKGDLPLSDTLKVHIHSGVGRAKDRSEPAFSYLKLQFINLEKDSPSNLDMVERKMGNLASNADFVKALRTASHQPRIVTLSKELTAAVTRTPKEVIVAFYRPKFEGGFEALPGYKLTPAKADEFARHLDAHVERMAKFLALADADVKPSGVTDEFPMPKTVIS